MTTLEDNGYEVPELLDENSFALTISAALTTQCGQYNSEGKALPTKCNATKDFYTGEALSALENRRNIRALEDLNYTVRAWQVVLTAMLSDYKYLYE